MTPFTLRILFFTIAALALSGCAVSKSADQHPRTLIKKDGSKALVSTKKSDEDRRTEKEKPEEDDEPARPREAIAPDKIEHHDGGGSGGGFEGDTYEKNPRNELESLVLDINKGIDSYREEFGVEGFSTAQPGSCDEVCDLSEAICKSSTKICAIATSNPDEAYFGAKCQWSTKECKRSNEQCATCSK